MSNYSYLCSTEDPTIYPSSQQPSYDSDSQTLACDVFCIPLLWHTLFRETDIVQQKWRTPEGDYVDKLAPLTTLPAALAALEQARPHVVKLFEDRGNLGPYFDLFVSAIASAPHRFLTIELDEIECLGDPAEFWSRFRAALANIETSTAPQRKRLLELSQIRGNRRFPSARLLLDDLDGHDDDYWNHCRIFGAGAAEAGIGRPVPWEAE